MRSFLIKDGTPIIKWGAIPSEIYFEGKVPEGYSLAINPSPPYIILDVDVKGGKDGFQHIPPHIKEELDSHFNYPTKSGGRHYWLKYSGSKNLKNMSTKIGLDLRTNKGYVVWCLEEDVRKHLNHINNSSVFLNTFLEKYFS